MAAVQRKLVHKQFNSPMGLYSQANVKATLDRELKAFGADGIEIDEQITKPLNLANSAVLRAVEEEEQQVKCGDFYATPRQSRSRQRQADAPSTPQPPHPALHQQLLHQIKHHYLSHQNDVVIDRDTVLRINRMSTRRQQLKRDLSWPPAEPQPATGHSVTPSPTHCIDTLREKFNSPTRIVDLTPRDVRAQRLQPESHSSKQAPQRPQTPKKIELAKKPTQEHDDSEIETICHQTPKAKGFSAPETKAADADIGLVAPKCEYYEQLTNRRSTTPTPKPSTTYRPRLKRQSYSLDRGRARKRALALSGATELPPPKPRNGSVNGTPKVQRRSIKLATELRICYDTDDEEEPKATASQTDDIDLELLPLPAPPKRRAGTAAAKLIDQTQSSEPRKASTVIDGLAAKQQQQLALALAATKSQLGAQLQLDDGGRIIPVTVSVEMAQPTQPSQLQQSAASVQQVYDDACNYLRQDQNKLAMATNVSPSAHKEDASPPATYVSATSGIKLQRQDSASKYRTQSSQSSCIPTPPPLPPPPTVPLLRPKPREDAKEKPLSPPPTAPLLRPKPREDAKEKQTRRQGGIYCSSPETKTKQHEAHVEIAQLEAKYAHIQQSITEHLRQIDEYMENAKTALQRTVQTTPTPPTPPPAPPAPAAEPFKPINHNNNDLWDMFSSRQSPILAVESPLQAVLRQIYCRAAGIQWQPKEHATSIPDPSTETAAPTENVPIVERALEDLHKIALALDSDEHGLLQVEHKMTPTAIKAQHIVIEEEEKEEVQETAEETEDNDLSLDYRHVSDVIANYEQLSAGKDSASTHQELQQSSLKEGIIRSLEKQLSTGKESSTHQQLQKELLIDTVNKKTQQESKDQDTQVIKHLLELEHKEAAIDAGIDKPATEHQQQETDAVTSAGCTHEQATHDESLGSWCAVCGECRDSPHGWGKLNKADQWRFDNLHNEPLANYKSTYEIRSPYVSRQISWEETQPQESKEPLQRQRSFVEIVTTPVPDTKEWLLSRSTSPMPIRKYPAPLIDTALRCSSPFGLNPVQANDSPRRTPTPTPLEAKYTHIPQLEGHNIGLLVRTATEPLQLSMSASSSLLAAGTPPATPRCNSQPPPFDFLMQHGLGAQLEATQNGSRVERKFKSLATSSEELAQTTREFSVNRSFDNVSPRPYIGIEGYKRVAWPPASEERIVREFTPQPQQSPAPGTGGYYGQQPTAQPHGVNAAPAQGPIYNNVQPRTQQQPQPQPQPQQQAHHQYQYQQQQQQPQPAQNVYGSSTNYASNGYAPTAAPAAQVPANNNNYPQQPIQYTQAQFNRQRSREPVQAAAPAPAADSYAQYPQQHHQQQQQQQPQYQPTYQQQQQQQQQPQQSNYPVDNSGGAGWKHIRPPVPKSQNEYVAGGAAPSSGYPYQQQQQQPPQQHYQQQYQQQQPQQQYGAPTHDNYQQQQQPQQPAPQQWQQQQQQPPAHQQYQAPYQTSSTYQQQQQQQQPQPQQQNYLQQNGGANYAQPQYNSYSQPQQHQQQHQLPYSQDQTDQQQSYRGASPGIITLRKETPVSQTPAPVFTSQPAAVSYQGGSNLRGDLKWPPPEYKEAAARENEERRLLALGPVCRPRRINRDYTPFFAKHQLNNSYPSYKVPPGTQHMFG